MESKREASTPDACAADCKPAVMTVREAFAAAGFPVPEGTIALKTISGPFDWMCWTETDLYLWDPVFYPESGWDCGCPRHDRYAQPHNDVSNYPAWTMKGQLPEEVDPVVKG